MMMETGVSFTIAGVYKMVPSGRAWWQFWKPRLVPSNELRVFRTKGGTVTVASSLLSNDLMVTKP